MNTISNQALVDLETKVMAIENRFGAEEANHIKEQVQEFLSRFCDKLEEEDRHWIAQRLLPASGPDSADGNLPSLEELTDMQVFNFLFLPPDFIQVQRGLDKAEALKIATCFHAARTIIRKCWGI